MNELTIKLIYDIKQPKEEWLNDENNHSLTDFAICSLMEYANCKREDYPYYVVLRIVRQCFVDYLLTATHVLSTMNEYHRCLDRYLMDGFLFYPDTSKDRYTPKEYYKFEVEAMLTALQLTQVKSDKDGELKYINGFYDYEWKN